MEVQQLVLVREDAHLPRERRALAEDGGDSSTTDAQVQAPGEDEDGVEDAVEHHRQDGGLHGLVGVAGAAQDGVEAEVEVREDVAEQNPQHVFAGIAQRVLRGAEEEQDGVEERQRHHRQHHAHKDVQHEGVAQNLLSTSVVLLPQTDANHRGGTHTYHCAEGCRNVHQRKRRRQSAQRHRADAVADVRAVHNVVNGRGNHGHNGRNGVLCQQLAYFLSSQLGGYGFSCHYPKSLHFLPQK